MIAKSGIGLKMQLAGRLHCTCTRHLSHRMSASARRAPANGLQVVK
jgi:hypothetical protein